MTANMEIINGRAIWSTFPLNPSIQTPPLAHAALLPFKPYAAQRLSDNFAGAARWTVKYQFDLPPGMEAPSASHVRFPLPNAGGDFQPHDTGFDEFFARPEFQGPYASLLQEPRSPLFAEDDDHQVDVSSAIPVAKSSSRDGKASTLGSKIVVGGEEHELEDLMASGIDPQLTAIYNATEVTSFDGTSDASSDISIPANDTMDTSTRAISISSDDTTDVPTEASQTSGSEVGGISEDSSSESGPEIPKIPENVPRVPIKRKIGATSLNHTNERPAKKTRFSSAPHNGSDTDYEPPGATKRANKRTRRASGPARTRRVAKAQGTRGKKLSWTHDMK